MKVRPAYNATPGLPDALRAMLISARESLKRVNDDGTEATTRSRVAVFMGWPEIHAIYHLWSAAEKARATRDDAKKQLNASVKNLARHRADITDHDLVRDKNVLKLLEEARRLAAGEVVYDEEIRALHKRLDAFLKRAKKADRQRTARTRPVF